jgi:hypothetical protein
MFSTVHVIDANTEEIIDVKCFTELLIRFQDEMNYVFGNF